MGMPAQSSDRLSWRARITYEGVMTAAIDESARKARLDAGWTETSKGWFAPCGTSEEMWRDGRYALPEQPFYVDWRASFGLYEEAEAS